MDLQALTPGLRRTLAVALLGAVAVVLVVRQVTGGHAAAAIPSLRVATSHARVTQGVLVVDVAGAVRHAGIYRLPRGTRIADAVARAGGAVPAADLTLVNLAAPLADGEQVLVPARGGGSGEAAAGGSPAAPVDLNAASAEQLDALPGIGPATAAKIVAFRQQHGPFRTSADLDGVPGIGPARIAELKGLVVP
ncbi:MAG: helix-hairpin-helix domain-containing protein [Gaiellaceae bacterium]